jgi:plastocyanin
MGPVDLDDIESLTLNISDITLDYAGSTGVNTGPLTVSVLDGAFDPVNVSVETGDTVRWLWDDDSFHTVTSGEEGEPNAGDDFMGDGSAIGDVFEVTFNTGAFTPTSATRHPTSPPT